MSDLESYVTHKVVNGHCDCMFLINTDRWEWTTIAALVAPRPLLFANSDKDPIFPMDGNRRIIERLRRFYAMLGSPREVAEHISHGDHGDRSDLRLATYRWMNAHLKHDTSPLVDAADPPIDGKQLRVFPEDGDLPADARNARIDETFITPARPALPNPSGLAEWRGVMIGRLCRPRSDRSPSRSRRVGRNPRPRPEDGCNGWRRSPASRSPCSTCVRPTGADRCILVVLNENERLDRLPDWATPYVADDAVVVLAPRGVGPTAWTRKNPPNYIERAHAPLGRTVDEGRVRDIMATVGWIAGPSRGTARFAWPAGIRPDSSPPMPLSWVVRSKRSWSLTR